MKAREILESEAKNNAFSHAYLFVGNNQSEIDEIVNYIVAVKGCVKEDISALRPEMEAFGKKGEIKIDDVRALLHEANLSPQGNCRLVIIYNCERLNQSSGNILLKTLEEPPPNLIMVLTAKSDHVLPTIKSRCRVIAVNEASEEVSGGQFVPIFQQGFFEASSEIEKIVKNNQIEECLMELADHLRKRLLQKKEKSTADLLAEIFKTKKEIAGNANPRLALESLFLTLKREI